MNSSDLLTIRGYVQSLPSMAGGEDKAKVAVITEDGAEYRILHKGAGVGLAVNINANVEVAGRLHAVAASSGDDGHTPDYLLAVRSYRLTDGFDDPWYDDAVR